MYSRAERGKAASHSWAITWKKKGPEGGKACLRLDLYPQTEWTGRQSRVSFECRCGAWVKAMEKSRNSKVRGKKKMVPRPQADRGHRPGKPLDK